MTVVTQLSGYSPARVLQVVLGLTLILLGAWVLAVYPVGRPWLLALGLALGLAQWRDDKAWLFALPVLLACLDLGAWSLGKGLGAFPLSNLLDSGSGKEGIWFFSNGTAGANLRLVGGGDLCVGQRLVSPRP